MRRRRVKSVTVCGYTYKIKPLTAREAEEVWGHIDHVEQTIRIAKGLTFDQWFDTLVHEIGHAAYHHGALEPGDEEERVVTVVTSGVATALLAAGLVS